MLFSNFYILQPYLCDWNCTKILSAQSIHLLKCFIHKPSKHLEKRDIKSKKKITRKIFCSSNSTKNLTDIQQFESRGLAYKSLTLTKKKCDQTI